MLSVLADFVGPFWFCEEPCEAKKTQDLIFHQFWLTLLASSAASSFRCLVNPGLSSEAFVYFCRILLVSVLADFVGLFWFCVYGTREPNLVQRGLSFPRSYLPSVLADFVGLFWLCIYEPCEARKIPDLFAISAGWLCRSFLVLHIGALRSKEAMPSVLADHVGFFDSTSRSYLEVPGLYAVLADFVGLFWFCTQKPCELNSVKWNILIFLDALCHQCWLTLSASADSVCRSLAKPGGPNTWFAIIVGWSRRCVVYCCFSVVYFVVCCRCCCCSCYLCCCCSCLYRFKHKMLHDQLCSIFCTCANKMDCPIFFAVSFTCVNKRNARTTVV